jgi:SAM-dependent methyltransferase
VARLTTSRLSELLHRGYVKVRAPRLRCHGEFLRLFADKSGLELGGPSALFVDRGLFPVYPTAARIDNCNFATETLWEGRIATNGFRPPKARTAGRQLFAEATDLSGLAASQYDFVISSHTLEHSANPLLALSEWRRVLKPGGTLFLVLPHKDGTFDHRRPATPLAHLIDDWEQGTTEDDLSHLPEILQLHDLSLDPDAGSAESFRQRSLQNPRNRCLHQHVFDAQGAVELVNYCGLLIRAVELARPFHIAILATQPVGEMTIDNGRFLQADAQYRRHSPFPSDRRGR